MIVPHRIAGREAVAAHGWFVAHKWLILRRISQIAILGLFLIGPAFGWWLVKGTLASSLTLGVLPLTDPYMLLQSLVAGHAIGATAALGAGIVLACYLIVGGRVYCSWVCPINPITDAAAWLRAKLGLTGGITPSRKFRLWLLAATFVVAAATGTLAWELVNPVSIVFRGIVFGLGLAWLAVLVIFLFDSFIGRRAWCGHVCPVGAFYGLIGRFAVLRVNAANRDACTDCMDCYAVCPESHVITPALRGAQLGHGPVIRSGDCTNCGRCIDVCPVDVFHFGTRFHPAPRNDSQNRGPAGLPETDRDGKPADPVSIRELAS